MTEESFHTSPGQGESIHQIIDSLVGVEVVLLRQVCVFGGCQKADMTQYFL